MDGPGSPDKAVNTQMLKAIRQMMEVMQNHESRVNMRELGNRDRSPSRKRKHHDMDSDDESGLDVSAAMGRYGLQINVAVLPQYKVIARCVKDAKKSVKAGGVPIVTGKLDERFIPSGQRASAWAANLDTEKMRFQAWWSLWWGRAHTQLICQSVTNKQLLTMGQIHEWQSNINSIALSENAMIAMKYDEMGYEQLVAQAEARSPTLDAGALLDLNGSLLAKAKQAVEKLSKGAQTGTDASSSKGAGRQQRSYDQRWSQYKSGGRQQKWGQSWQSSTYSRRDDHSHWKDKRQGGGSNGAAASDQNATGNQ